MTETDLTISGWITQISNILMNNLPTWCMTAFQTGFKIHSACNVTIQINDPNWYTGNVFCKRINRLKLTSRSWIIEFEFVFVLDKSIIRTFYAMLWLDDFEVGVRPSLSILCWIDNMSNSTMTFVELALVTLTCNKAKFKCPCLYRKSNMNWHVISLGKWAMDIK